MAMEIIIDKADVLPRFMCSCPGVCLPLRLKDSLQMKLNIKL